MAVDLKSLNQNQLNKLIAEATQRQSDLKKENAAKVKEKIHNLIKAEGFTFDELFGTSRGRKRATGSVAPKYRNPANPDQTWSGRGKHPRWFNDALKAGKKEKDLLI